MAQMNSPEVKSRNTSSTVDGALTASETDSLREMSNQALAEMEKFLDENPDFLADLMMDE